MYHGAAGVSGVLFLVALGFWIASFSSRYTLMVGQVTAYRMIAASRGEVIVSAMTFTGEISRFAEPTEHWIWKKSPPEDIPGIGTFPGSSAVAGFMFRRVALEGQTGFTVLLPIPFLVVLFAPLPLVDVMMIRRRRRRRVRAAAGLCIACGYDLRASPEKCPECGAVPGAQAARPGGAGGSAAWMLACITAIVFLAGCSTDSRPHEQDKGDTMIHTTLDPDWVARTITTTTQPWKASAVLIYSQDGTSAPLEARQAQYLFHTPPSTNPYADFSYDATVFVNPATGHVWAGRKVDCYIETATGIVGFWPGPGGDMRWYDSAIKEMKPKERLDGLVQRFEREKGYFKLHEDTMQGTDLNPFVEVDFFAPFPMSSAPPTFAKILEMNVINGQLFLRLESPTGEYHASVYIDIKTREVVRAFNEGKQVFPEPGT
ncbi:MAG: hypothetical protein JWN40_80 [Phycisphaerales bacterium]|nr:hypothetical protein [Phycisphaerales bacterium]